MGKSGLWSIIWVLSLIPCISFAQGVSPETNILSSQLDTLIKYQLPEGSNVSISVYDLTANEALYDYQADKLSRPASTMKLLTTITALARPEADEPFSTEVWYKGVIERDTLKGDIYVVGGFDPEFDDEALDSLVGSVARLPFSVVQGRIYGDVSMKDSLYWGSGWLWDDTPYSFTDSATWPKNLDSTYRGLVSVEEAVAQSINTVPVKLVAQMTPEYSFEFAIKNMLFLCRSMINNVLFLIRQFAERDIRPHTHLTAYICHQRPHQTVPGSHCTIINTDGIIRYQ